MTSDSFTMNGVTSLCKLVPFSVLIFLFIFFFGLPSWEKFHAGGLTVEHSTETSEEGNLLPGITVCPYHANPRTPWRNANATMDRPEDILAKECNISSGIEMWACIEEKTYMDIEQVVYSVSDKNYVIDKSELDYELQYAGGVRGTCHTLTYRKSIGTNLYKDSFQMKLNPNISFDIFLHDPVFFWPTFNPSAIANAKISIDEGPTGDGIELLFLEVMKHKKLNTLSRPCDFAFAKCVNISMANRYISNTSTTDEIHRFDLFLTEMAFATTSELAKITGCQKPCEFMEYKLVGGKADAIKKDHGFVLTYTSNDMSVLTEVR